MNKKRLLLLSGLTILSLTLTACGGDKDNKVETNNKNQIKNQMTQKQQNTLKQTINDRYAKIAKRVGIENYDKAKFEKMYKVFVFCQRGYCKNQYEELKKDKIALEYWNKFLTRNHIPKGATKYNSLEEKMDDTLKDGYKTLKDCLYYYRKDYSDVKACLKDNYKNFSDKEKKKVKDYILKTRGTAINIPYNIYGQVKFACGWWASKNYAIGEELKKQLDKMVSEGFNGTNYIDGIWEGYYSNMNKQEFYKKMKKTCQEKFVPKSDKPTSTK